MDKLIVGESCGVMSERRATVGVLWPGEMGASVASMLRARGRRVVTTLRMRSARTARLAREAGIEPLDSLERVIRESSVVLSLVVPAAAEATAEACLGVAHLAPANAVFVDLNSTGPEQATRLAGKFESAGMSFVDGAINGLAKNLTSGGTLFLSGSRAAEIAELFEAMRVRTLGDEIGRAKTMKMLLAGLSKGMCALYLELAALGHRRGMLDEMIAAASAIYPGMAAVVERMAPTYPQHAARRATEMRELEQTVASSGIEPNVIAAVRRLHETIANVSFDTDADANGFTVTSLVRRMAADPVAGEPLDQQGR